MAAVLSPHHPETVSEKCKHKEMEHGEGPEHRRIRVQKFPEKALHRIKTDHEMEAGTEHQRRAVPELPDEPEQKAQHGEALIELHWMARDAVAEIDAPGKRGRNPIGVVRQAGEKAAPAADRD